MKIETIVIKNFRIFNGLYKFDFSNRDVIIINGTNGNGKSTIFDSIQWCLTGEIPRYKGTDEWRKFNFLMNENIYKTEGKQSMFVEVRLKTTKGKIFKIRRSSEKDSAGNLSSSNITINDEAFNISKGAKEIREILTREGLKHERSGKKNEINLASFFASTQVLSQDALHDFIRADKPSERYKVINGILGIGKYGEDFEKFIELSQKIVEEQKEKLLNDLEKPYEKLNKIKMKISEKEELRLEIGEESEQELINSTEKLLEEIRELEIVTVEFPNPISKIQKNLQDSLIKIKQNITQSRGHQEKIRLDVESSREIFSITPEMYTDNKSKINCQIKMLRNKRSRRGKGRDIVRDRKLKLETFKIKRGEYQREKEYYKVLKTRITENNSVIQSILAHEEVAKAINGFGGKQAFIEIYKRSLQEQNILKKVLRCIEINRGLEEIKNKCLIQSKDAKRYNKQLDEIKESQRFISSMVTEFENEVSERKNSTLDELVHQVQGHVLEKENETICPVCGVDHKTNEEFKASITKKINVFKESLSKLEETLFDFKAKESIYKEEIRLIILKKKKMDSEIDESKKLEEVLKLEKEQLITEVPQINLYLTNNDLNITEIYKQKEKILSDYQLSFGMVNSLVEKEENLSELERAVLSQKNVLVEFRNEAKHWAKYLDLEEKEINRKIPRIDDYLIRVDEEELHLNQKELELNKAIIQLDLMWKQREAKIRDFQKEDTSFTGAVTELDKIKDEVNKSIRILNEAEGNLRIQLAKIHIFLQDDEIKALKKKKKSIEIEVAKKEEVLEGYNDFLNRELAALKASHTLANSELISDYLSQHSEYINQLFMQISPHSVYRYVQLVPRGKNLYVVMTKNHEDARKLRELDEQELKRQFNASLMFSSGQSNVLALCIFLALNRSQKWTELKFVGIDDPFQNLDDINIFSFVDVISQIVSLQNKQLLISTHNEDFASLIRAKMGLNPEKIGNIIFQAYNDEGASVKGNCVVEGEEGISVS
ncbi:AAA family ATPase [Bacillus wiedmannii]|uniref:AAA family ATPase n=1 Tax=Bacillus wiedmannii TaxID=1890302 RepID=UPI003CF43AC1